MSITFLNQDNFQSTLDAESRTVLIDFYADWCMPCKMIAPLLEEIAAEKSADVVIYKVNVDENPNLAMSFDIRSIPNLISFRGGKVYKRGLGAMPKPSLLELVE